jgi:hypothetical protein
MARDKNFKLRADQIRPLIPPMGGCFATDRITVDGMPVGYMYREAADFAEDSGWRFFAGDETEEYLEATEHTGIYEVNTICNHDPEIIPHLDTTAGGAFERDPRTGRFTRLR